MRGNPRSLRGLPHSPFRDALVARRKSAAPRLDTEPPPSARRGRGLTLDAGDREPEQCAFFRAANHLQRVPKTVTMLPREILTEHLTATAIFSGLGLSSRLLESLNFGL
jgi:hypothetical protein